MNRTLFIMAITVVVMLIPSCKRTTERTNSASTSGDSSSPSGKEKDALRLLGRSAGVSSPNLLNSDGSLVPNSQAMLQCSDEFSKGFLGAEIADSSGTELKTFANKCPQFTPITLYVEKNPDIQEIQTILGSENAPEKEKIDWLNSTTKVEVTWYKYAWLDFGAANFGVAKGKVVVLRVHTDKLK